MGNTRVEGELGKVAKGITSGEGGLRKKCVGDAWTWVFFLRDPLYYRPQLTFSGNSNPLPPFVSLFLPFITLLRLFFIGNHDAGKERR